MIGREKLGEMSIIDIDKEINDRATTLNAMGDSLLPQILAEEVAELRAKRTELEETMTRKLMAECGMEHGQARMLLVHHNWNYEEAKT